jgi:hypothetical protein
MPEGFLFDTVTCSRWRRGDRVLRQRVEALPRGPHRNYLRRIQPSKLLTDFMYLVPSPPRPHLAVVGTRKKMLYRLTQPEA